MGQADPEGAPNPMCVLSKQGPQAGSSLRSPRTGFLWNL